MNVFSTRLLQQRVAKGMTQAALARHMGITSAAISNLEHGRTAPSARLLEATCFLFNVRPDYMLGWGSVAAPRKGVVRPKKSIFPPARSGR